MYTEEKMSCGKIGILLGVSGGTVHRRLLESSVNLRDARGITARKPDRHPRWKGGVGNTKGNKTLHWSLLTEEDRCKFGSMITKGMIRERRLVAAKKIGRPLRKGERTVVLNGNKHDTRPENVALSSDMGVTRDELYNMYVHEKMSLVDISKKLGKWPQAITRMMNSLGIEKKDRSVSIKEGFETGKRVPVKGRKHGGWKRGRYSDKRGNVILCVSEMEIDDKYLVMVKNGKVQEHRIVAAMKIGRPLEKGEHVKHINGDRTDNRPENLLVLEKHLRAERKRLRASAR
jgi:hypothetical protein